MTEKKTDLQKLICESVEIYISFFQEIKQKGYVTLVKRQSG